MMFGKKHYKHVLILYYERERMELKKDKFNTPFFSLSKNFSTKTINLNNNEFFYERLTPLITFFLNIIHSFLKF